MRFEDALAFGNDTEKTVAAHFLNSGATVRTGSRNGNFDLWVSINDCPLRIEVKCEDKHAQTGNICVETLQGMNGCARPSGLSVSDSQLCIHTLGEMAAIYRTQEMRLHIARKTKEGALEVRAFPGADNGNRGVIVSISSLLGLDWFEHTRMSAIPKSRLIEKVSSWKEKAL